MGLGPLNTRLGRLRRRILYPLLIGLAVFVSSLASVRPVEAAVGVNGQINFQGRLLNAQGAAVADGYYNVQFRIYQDGDGQTANNASGSPAGSLEWTETYLNANSQGVLVRNGFMSVQLGSVTAFGSNIDWNQDTLWLSMNVAGLNNSCTPFANCSPDGEMLPMKRLSSSAYAMNAGQLGGLTAAGFIQNGTSPQTADFNITGNGTIGGSLTVTGTYNSNTFTSSALTFGAASAASIQSAATQSLSIDSGSTGNLNIGTGANAKTITIGNSTGNTNVTLNSGTGNINLLSSGTNSGTVIRSDSNSAASLVVQNSTNQNVLAVDTVNSQLLVNKVDALTAAGGAVTRTNRTAASSATGFGTGSYTPAGTFTPAAGSVLVAYVSGEEDGTAAILANNGTDLTITGGGLTWTPILGRALDDPASDYETGMRAFYAVVGSTPPANMQVTVDTGAYNIYRYHVVVDQYTNVDLQAPIGGAVSASRFSDSSDIFTLDLGLSPAAGDVKIAMSAVDVFSITGHDTPAGWTLINRRGDLPELQIASLTGTTSRTLNFDMTATIPSDTTTVYGGFFIRQANGNSLSVGGSNALTTTIGNASTNSTANIIAGDGGVNLSASRITGVGQTAFRAAADVTTAFQVQNASGSASIFNVDTVNGRIGINTAMPGYSLDVVGDINSSSGYRVAGTAGSSTTCAAGQVLSATIVQGGIVTGGTCVTASDGVTTVGTFSASSIANGASITGNTIVFGAADAVNPGMISTTSQTFAGDKTFSNNVAVNGTYNGNAFTGNELTFSSATTSVIQSASSQSLLLNGRADLTVQTNGTTRATFDTSNTLYLGNGATAAAPNNFTISSTGSNVTGVAGGALTIQGGDASVGNANGGNLYLRGGNGVGTGVDGLVVISTPTFSTTSNDANCYTGGALVPASCTITADSVNSSAVIVVGFTVNGQTATLPDPTLAMAGRVVYITAANGSSDFTLSSNGGGVGNAVAMRQNTSATMIWNGADWTAAGASSSTTLQSAYDSTLQTAGGAELIVSKTSSTNGLTIRDSSTSPVDGTLFSVQTNSAANLLTVNSNITEYASNAGAETAGASSSTFPASTWNAIGSTVSRYTTAGNFIAGGQASVSVVTPATANTGVRNTLSTTLTANTLYNVSFAARLSSGTFTDLNVYYSIDGTAASVSCTTGQAVNSSVQTKINCAFKAPASGITSSNAILIRQTSGTARTFYVDNLSVTIAADYNYATDGSVDDGTNFATNWTAVGSTVTRSTSFGNDASNSAQVDTTAGSDQGVRNKLSVNPLQSTTYRVTAYASSNTSGFDSFTVRYSRDGGTNFASCADYNTQEVGTPPTNFTKITCYITTDSTAATNAYVYFTQNDAVARTFYVDTFSMTLSSKITPNVQIGGGVNGGPVTLLTMDRAAAAPIASNNEALLGSMYYDTTLGKLQCYEADGWGACGSSPDDVITISPEYTNAVLHGTGVGTMTSDICSDTLNINDGSSGQATICGSNETYNFYKWTSPQATAQTYSIFVTYQLPTTFKTFLSGQASLMGRTDSTNSTVRYQIYRQDTSSGLVACGSTVSVSTGSVSSWQTGIATGAADPSTCGFTPGSSIVFKIDVVASSNANAYVGNLNFAFNNN